jgi:glucose-1-phosphate thymidylyltransferase
MTVSGPLRELVGIIPAAGSAQRVSPLPCSKELFPIGFRRLDDSGELRPKAAAHYLLERMAGAGARKAYVVLGDGKWDIPAYFGDGEPAGMDLAYLVIRESLGVAFSVDAAYPFTRDSTVVFGFPDIIYWPEDALSAVVERHRVSGADFVVAVVPTDRPEKNDLVDLDQAGKIVRMEIKQPDSKLRHTWMLAVWGPEFTEFLHEFVAEVRPEIAANGGLWQGRELYPGDVLWAAIERGLSHDTVLFEEGGYVDIGTPDELTHAVRKFGESTAGSPESADPA